MATTTNYSWTTPDDTALVKDGAAAIRSLGTAIDTTVFNNAGAAIAKTIVDAKGDLIVGTAADTVARLASSASNGNILTVDTSTATGLKWAAPAGGGKVLQVVSAVYSTAKTISATSFIDTDLTCDITPTSATSKILVIVSQSAYIQMSSPQYGGDWQLQRGATKIFGSASGQSAALYFEADNPPGGTFGYAGYFNFTYLDSPATTSLTTYKTTARMTSGSPSREWRFQYKGSDSSITLLEIGA